MGSWAGAGIDEGVFAFLLAFARVGSAVMLMPGIGEEWIPRRARLFLALGLSAILLPTVDASLAAAPFSERLRALLCEVITGVALGALMRLFLAAPAIAGQATSQLSSLSNIFVAAGMPMNSSSVLSVWFLIGAIMFIFLSGLHLLMIETVAYSYTLIPPGVPLLFGDAARHAAVTFAQVFALGVRMAVPFIVLSFIFNAGIGLVNKMQPNIPVYFIAMPVSILGSFYVLAHATAPLLLAYRDTFGAWLADPFGGV